MHAFFFFPGPPDLIMSLQFEHSSQSFLWHPSHELQCLRRFKATGCKSDLHIFMFLYLKYTYHYILQLRFQLILHYSSLLSVCWGKENISFVL